VLGLLLLGLDLVEADLVAGPGDLVGLGRRADTGRGQAMG
jgi:hypothetical protein